jgi:hypothetical protein
MKKLLTSVLAIAFFACTLNLTAQDEKAAPSPFSKVEQKIGTTDVTVEYSRPGVKDRKIFGELVPFDKKWRTGANAATKVTFSKDVTVQGAAVPAGTYAVFTTPGKTSWDVHFFTFGEAGAGAYNDATPVATVKTEPVDLGDIKIESFMIFFDMLRDNSAQMIMTWDSTAVFLALGVK